MPAVHCRASDLVPDASTRLHHIVQSARCSAASSKALGRAPPIAPTALRCHRVQLGPQTHVRIVSALWQEACSVEPQRSLNFSPSAVHPARPTTMPHLLKQWQMAGLAVAVALYMGVTPGAGAPLLPPRPRPPECCAPCGRPSSC